MQQLPNTFAELLKMTMPIEVVCKAHIDRLDIYPENRMRLTILNTRDDSDNVVLLYVSYEKYDEYNKQFESSEYYDRDGNPTLTARQANFYNVKDTMYVESVDNPNDFFELLKAKQSMAERFVDAWNEWYSSDTTQADFYDWYNKKFLDTDDYCPHIACWNLFPNKETLRLQYDLMDFEDGSIAVRRCWSNRHDTKWKTC